MQHIQLLLDQVIRGNLSAFEEFRLKLQEAQGSWQIIDTLRFLNQQFQINPDTKLNYCVPEALVEFANLLLSTPGYIELVPEVQSFIKWLKMATFVNNCGAFAALLMIRGNYPNILNEREYEDILLRAQREINIQNQSRDHLFLTGLLYYLNLLPPLPLVNSNLDVAVMYFQRAAQQGSVMAMSYLSMINIILAGFNQNESIKEKYYQDAEHLAERAAIVGNVSAVFFITDLYMGGRAGTSLSLVEQHNRKIQWLKQSANLGNLQATLTLADMYKYGFVDVNMNMQDRLTLEKLYCVNAFKIYGLLNNRQKMDELSTRIEMITKDINNYIHSGVTKPPLIRKMKKKEPLPNLFHWKKNTDSGFSLGKRKINNPQGNSVVGGPAVNPLSMEEQPIVSIPPKSSFSQTASMSTLIEHLRLQEHTIAQQAKLLEAKDKLINTQEDLIKRQQDLAQPEQQLQVVKQKSQLSISSTLWVKRKTNPERNDANTSNDEETEIATPKLPSKRATRARSRARRK